MKFHILRQQGLSIRKIAQLCGVSRNRVRRALRSATPPSGKRERSKGAKLTPFTSMVDAWLRDPVKSQWTAERIFEEIVARGYAGGRTVVKEYVRAHRPQVPKIAEARFYVRPGQQLQVDWAEMGPVTIEGVTQKVYAFVAILAWSRTLYVRFTTDMQLLTWLDCHRRAFEYFGGVPGEVLIDNLKTGVMSRAGETVRWHPKYEEFAVAHGFTPIAHFPMRPKTKGRVERIVRFVRERFFTGRDFVDLEQFNASAVEWLHERANRRVHRITRERPCDRFNLERTALQPLPAFDVKLEAVRVADAYALVSYGGVRYSIPAQYARKPVTLHLRISGMSIIADSVVVAEHVYAKKGLRLVQLAEHLPPQPEPRHERFAGLGDRIVAAFGDLGRRYVREVERRAPHAPLALLREIFEREAEFGKPIVARSLETLLQFGVIKRNALSRLCYRYGETPRLLTPSSAPLPGIEVERRPLARYDEVAA